VGRDKTERRPARCDGGCLWPPTSGSPARRHGAVADAVFVARDICDKSASSFGFQGGKPEADGSCKANGSCQNRERFPALYDSDQHHNFHLILLDHDQRPSRSFPPCSLWSCSTCSPLLCSARLSQCFSFSHCFQYLFTSPWDMRSYSGDRRCR
jgi:hypothetical protein